MLLMLADTVESAPLALDRSIRLPAGIRLRLPRGFVATPQPAPQIATYSNPANDERIEAVAPVEQWRYEQLIARFKGDEGEITLARIKHVPFDKIRLLSGGHAIKKDYIRRLADAPTPANPEAYRAWVNEWTGTATNTPQTAVRGVLLRNKYMFMSFPGVPVQKDQVWLLALQNGAIMLRCKFPSLSERDAQRTAVNILKTVAEIRIQTTANNADADDPLSQARQRVQQGIQNVPGWWAVDTRNYVIASNLERRNRALVDLLRRDIEVIRSAYEALFPPSKPITAVSVIRVFADKQGYANYVAPDMRWTSGVWDPSRKELVIAGDKSASSRELRDSVLNTAWHEAFHQYLFYALDYRSPPIWLNEGYACLFESCEIDTVRRQMRIKDNDSRREWLQHMLKERPQKVDVERLLRMNRLQFYLMGQSGKNAEIARSDNYAMAWGMAWFLTKAAPLYQDRNYDRIVPAILERLAQSEDTVEVANAGASATNLQMLQRDFIDFWRDRRKQGKAERNNILPGLR
jgi:hypothetical protein